MSGATTSCSQCGAPFEIGDEFCEACGGSLTPHGTAAAQAAPLAVLPKVSPGTDTATSPPQDGSRPSPGTGAEAGAAPTAETARTGLASSVCACGGRIADDGYCEECGAKGRSERDHWTEQPVTWVGGACDRGVRHHRNEDAIAMVAQPEPGSFGALIVCDGVSTASNSDVASLAAARASRDIMAASVRPTSTTISARITHWTGVLEAAAAAGNAEVCSTEATELGPERSAPACTFVAAIVDRDLITVGWVGDSRAYWFPDDGVPQALSIDHSVASDDIARGVARSVAESGNMAHAITRWFGDDTPTAVPQCLTTIVASAGWLLVCSDGLWNYSSAAPDLAMVLVECVRATATNANNESCCAVPSAVADQLVAWANAQGGHDNISVVLARIPNPAFVAQ